MDKSSIHFKDAFFEEILNGIPNEDNREEIIELAEKGTKTNLSSNEKMRINNVVKAFLHDEESKALFVNIIKNAKNREKLNWIKKFNLNFLLNLKEDDEEKDDEDELIEEIDEEEKSKGAFSSFKELKRKYETIKTWREREKRLRRTIYFLKDSYVFLSNITFASMFGSKTKLIRGMNETFADMFHEFKPKYIDPLLYSGSYSLTTLTNILTREIKSKVNQYYEMLNALMSLPLEIMADIVEAFAISAATGGSGSVTFLAKGYKWGKRVYEAYEKLVFIINNWDKIKVGSHLGLFALTGSLSESSKRYINNQTQKTVSKIRNNGDNLAKSILNNKGVSVSDAVSSLGIGEGFGELTNMGKKFIDDQIRQFGDDLIEDLESKLSLQQKFNVAYIIATSAYTERVEKSPWSKAISYLKHIVKASENLFYPFLDNLKSIVFENKSILNSRGTPLNIEKYLKTIIEQGLVIDDGRGGKYRLINRHKKSQVKKQGEEKANSPKIKISIQTSQSVVNTIKTENGKVVEDSFGKKQFNPLLNVLIDKDIKLGNNFKFHNYYRVRGTGNDDFNEENIISGREYNSSDIKLNEKWVEKINESNLSPLGHFFNNLFQVYEFPHLGYDTYKFKKSEMSNEYEYYEIPMVFLSKTEGLSFKMGDRYTWFDVLNYEGYTESIMRNCAKQMVDNYTNAYNTLKQLDLNQF